MSRRDCVFTNNEINHGAISSPTVPPVNASRRLSVSSWRTTRQLFAPNDKRIATSLRRLTPRASSNPPMLAHAINKTRPTTPISSLRGEAKRLRRIEMPCPPGSNLMCCSLNGRPFVIVPGGVLACFICWASRSSPDSASVCEMPGFTRASNCKKRSLRFSMNFDCASCGCISTGTQSCVGVSKTMPLKFSGATPTIVSGKPLIVIF